MTTTDKNRTDHDKSGGFLAFAGRLKFKARPHQHSDSKAFRHLFIRLEPKPLLIV